MYVDALSLAPVPRAGGALLMRRADDSIEFVDAPRVSDEPDIRARHLQRHHGVVEGSLHAVRDRILDSDVDSDTLGLATDIRIRTIVVLARCMPRFLPGLYRTIP